jgi:hypothetical protein
VVEIRVAVADATHAHGLMRHLVGLFDRPSVSFDGARGEVRVCSEWGSRAIVQVIGTVESWLTVDGVDSATLTVGDRSYTMVGPTGAAPSGRAA